MQVLAVLAHSRPSGDTQQLKELGEDSPEEALDLFLVDVAEAGAADVDLVAVLVPALVGAAASPCQRSDRST